MTKGKRDIFTVIESINNWFEAGEHYTNPPVDHEGSCSNSERTTGLEICPEIDAQAAGSGISATHTEVSDKVGCKSPNCHPGHVGSEVIPELSREIPGRSSDSPRPSTKTEGVAGYEGEATHDGEPGDPTLDNRLIPPVVTEESDQTDYVFTGIWRVFKEAGYDVW